MTMQDYIQGVLYSRLALKNGVLYLYYTHNTELNGVICDLFDYIAKKGKPAVLKGSDRRRTLATANIKG